MSVFLFILIGGILAYFITKYWSKIICLLVGVWYYIKKGLLFIYKIITGILGAVVEFFDPYKYSKK